MSFHYACVQKDQESDGGRVSNQGSRPIINIPNDTHTQIAVCSPMFCGFYERLSDPPCISTTSCRNSKHDRGVPSSSESARASLEKSDTQQYKQYSFAAVQCDFFPQSAAHFPNVFRFLALPFSPARQIFLFTIYNHPSSVHHSSILVYFHPSYYTF